MDVPQQTPVYTYEWQWRIQTSLPCPIKTGGSNSGAWAGAASLYLSNTNQAAQDVSSTFRQLKAGDTIRIEHKTDSTIYSIWTLAVPPIDYGSCFTFPTSKVEYHGAPVDNTVYRAVITSGTTTTDRLSIGQHMFNLCTLANGILRQGQNIPLQTVGQDAVKIYTGIVDAYLATPQLPQPVPPPAVPTTMAL
jgi:hypothetical protein